MFKFVNKRLRNRKGFTLIELIVVIAILGILAAIAIPRFAGSLNTAKQETHEANLRTINSAVSLYVAENGTAMTDMDDIGVLIDQYLAANPDNPLTSTEVAGYQITDGVAAPNGN